MKGAPTVRGRRGASKPGGWSSSALICVCAAAMPSAGERCRAQFRGPAGGSRRAWRAPSTSTIAEALIAPISQIRPATYLGKGKVEEIVGLDHRARHRTRGDGLRAVADPAAQSREGLEHQGARPHRADSRNLRPPRQDQGRRAAGRARASELSAQPAGAIMDPSGAPARRLRLHGRPRRNPDRGRPPPDRRPHRAAGERNQEGAGDAAAASRRTPAGAVSRRGAGRLHQCRQVDAVQPPDPRRRAGGRHAVRDARSDLARAEPAAWRQGDAVGYRRIHLQPADATGGRVSRDAGGGAGGRRHSPRPRHLA